MMLNCVTKNSDYSTYTYMGVSENSGTPKSSILIGVSIINHPFWGITIVGNTHICIYIYIWSLPLPTAPRSQIPSIIQHLSCSASTSVTEAQQKKETHKQKQHRHDNNFPMKCHESPHEMPWIISSFPLFFFAFSNSDTLGTSCVRRTIVGTTPLRAVGLLQAASFFSTMQHLEDHPS